MSCRLIIRSEAEADMVEAFAWCEERRAGLGHEFLGEIRSILNAITEHPFNHSIIYREVRRRCLADSPTK